MIGLQIGTLVAQVVIIGDLGPAIVSKALGLQVCTTNISWSNDFALYFEGYLMEEHHTFG